jgi:hypothetical protein
MLDTDSCITFLKGTHPQAFRRITAGPLGDVGLSSIALTLSFASLPCSKSLLSMNPRRRSTVQFERDWNAAAQPSAHWTC